MCEIDGADPKNLQGTAPPWFKAPARRVATELTAYFTIESAFLSSREGARPKPRDRLRDLDYNLAFPEKPSTWNSLFRTQIRNSHVRNPQNP